jgi:hypothetical protein
MRSEGCHFKAHSDTVKEQSMFATLVIQLSGEYEGGTMMVMNREEVQTDV